jgi:flagellar hook-associated protein 2
VSTSVNSALSFQGLSTGIQTDALVSAILAQDGVGVVKMQTQETQNNAASTALTTMKSNLNTLMTSLAALQDTFNARTVTSTDTTSTYVTATASGAAAASYDLSVGTVATKGRISPSMMYSGASDNPVVSFNSATSKTTTGAVAFDITSYSGGGPVSGTFTVGGTAYTLSGTNGTLTGAAGTPLEGLSVSVSGTGTGTLTVSGPSLVVADPNASIFTGTEASFAVQGTDGVTKAFTVPSSNNSLNGLRDAINASGAGVTASIINTGSGATPYQLVISANDTGTGTTNGVVTLAAIDNPDGASTVVNPSLGITAGTITGSSGTYADNFAAPTGLSGGLASSTSGASGVNAVFTLNGVQLTRQSNAVSDAVDGVTFNLMKGGETGTTTLTVAQDTGAASAGMQTVITNYNALLTAYKTASTSTKNADGSINQAPLGGNQTASGIINQLQAALTGASAGLAGTSAYTNLASLGVTTNADGTLSLNGVTFKNALNKDPAAALRLLTFSGRSSNGALTVTSGGPKTFTGTVGFTITDNGNGTYKGIFTGTGFTPITLTSSNGTFSGTGALAGLTLSVTGAGSGTLTLSRGAGQAASDLITQDVAYGTGALSAALTNMTTQNNYLDLQIAQGQAMLAQRKTTLQNQFSQMEVAVAQLKASASSLIGA